MTLIVRNSTGYILHKISTSTQTTSSPVHAFCRVCGWTRSAPNRRQARAVAASHAQRPAAWPTFHQGIAFSARSHPGHDWIVTGVSDDTATCAWALARGLGASPVDDVAPLLAREAVRAVIERRIDVVDAVLNARRRIRFSTADGTLMLVATSPVLYGNGYDIAVVGDFRAHHCWDNTVEPVLPTTAQHANATVSTASRQTITSVRTHGPRGRLLVTSGSVERLVHGRQREDLLERFRNPQTCAHHFFQAARRAEPGTSAAVLVLDPLSTD